MKSITNYIKESFKIGRNKIANTVGNNTGITIKYNNDHIDNLFYVIFWYICDYYRYWNRKNQYDKLVTKINTWINKRDYQLFMNPEDINEITTNDSSEKELLDAMKEINTNYEDVSGELYYGSKKPKKNWFNKNNTSIDCTDDIMMIAGPNGGLFIKCL